MVLIEPDLQYGFHVQAVRSSVRESWNAILMQIFNETGICFHRAHYLKNFCYMLRFPIFILSGTKYVSIKMRYPFL